MELRQLEVTVWTGEQVCLWEAGEEGVGQLQVEMFSSQRPFKLLHSSYAGAKKNVPDVKGLKGGEGG